MADNPLSKIPLVGSIFGGAPKYKPVDLDPGTAALIHEDTNRAINETPDEIAGQMTQGVNNAVHSLDGNADQEAARTGQDPHMLQAIQNKYKQQTGSDLTKFQNQSSIQAKMEHANRMRNVAASAMAQQQVQTSNFEALSNAYQQNEMARAQVVGSIAGVANTYLGMKIGANMKGQRPQSQINDFNSGGGIETPNMSESTMFPGP